MNHQELAGSAVCPIVGIGETGIDSEVVAGIRIHQVRRNSVEAFRSLPVTLLKLRPQIARPAADGVRPQQSEASGVINFPDFQLRLLFEDTDQYWRCLRHIAALQIGNYALGEWLHVTLVYTKGALRVTTGQRDGRCHRNACEKPTRNAPSLQ